MEQLGKLGIDMVEQSSNNVFEESGVDFLNTEENIWYDGMEVEN